MQNSSELLYHIILTVIDFHLEPSGSKRAVYILGTRATIEAAKDSAFRVLHTLRYKPDDFAEYAIHSSHVGSWDHGNGVLVYAKAPAGQVFLVSIQTTPNTELLLADRDGAILLPHGIPSLHYVTQTVIDYNKDRTGCVQEMQIEGTFIHRADARKTARKLLDPLDYAEYDTPEKMKGSGHMGRTSLHMRSQKMERIPLLRSRMSLIRITSMEKISKRDSLVGRSWHSEIVWHFFFAWVL